MKSSWWPNFLSSRNSNSEERQGMRTPLLSCPGGSVSDSPEGSPSGGSPRESIALAQIVPSETAAIHSQSNTPPRAPSPAKTEVSEVSTGDSDLITTKLYTKQELVVPIESSNSDHMSDINTPPSPISKLVEYAPSGGPQTEAINLHQSHQMHPFALDPLSFLKRRLQSAAAWINPLPTMNAYFHPKKPTAVAMQEVVVLNETLDQEEERFIKAVKDLMDNMHDASPLDYEQIFCGCFEKGVRATKSFQRLLSSLKWGSRILIVLPYAAFAGFSVGMQNILPLRAINDVYTPTGPAPLDEVSYISYCAFMISLAALSCSAWASTYGSSKITKLTSGVLMLLFGGIEQALYTYSAAGFFRSLQKDNPPNSDTIRIAVGLSAITIFSVHVGFNLRKLFRYHSSIIHPDVQEIGSTIPFNYLKFLTIKHCRKIKSVGHYIAYFVFRNISPNIMLLGIYNLFAQRIENLRYAHAVDGKPYDTETPLMVAQICVAIFAFVLLLPRTKKIEPIQKIFFYLAQYASWTLRTLGALAGLDRTIYAPEPTPELIVQLTGEPSFLYSIPLVKMYSNFYATPGKQILINYFYKEKCTKERNKNSNSTMLHTHSIFSPKDPSPFQTSHHWRQQSTNVFSA